MQNAFFVSADVAECSGTYCVRWGGKGFVGQPEKGTRCSSQKESDRQAFASGLNGWNKASICAHDMTVVEWETLDGSDSFVSPLTVFRSNPANGSFVLFEVRLCHCRPCRMNQVSLPRLCGSFIWKTARLMPRSSHGPSGRGVSDAGLSGSKMKNATPRRCARAALTLSFLTAAFLASVVLRR